MTGIRLPILSDVLITNTLFLKYKINATINKLLLARDKFMPEMHLKQPNNQDLHIMLEDHSLKINKEYKKIKETRDSRYIYQNKLGKACFQHDMADEDFKDLNRRTIANKVLRDKSFNIVKNPKHDGHQQGFESISCKVFDKKKFWKNSWK